MENETIGILVQATGRTGVLHQLTGVIARHEGDITSVEILDNWPAEARTYFEVVLPGGPDALLEDLRKLTIVRSVEIVKTLQKIYGKRIIIMGGGAQVGQVPMLGARKPCAILRESRAARSLRSEAWSFCLPGNRAARC
jgi:energy-converting hydrogenase B subunit Q